jgi:hypothetical protein
LEIGAEIFRVLRHHLFDAQLFQSFERRWNADQAAAMHGHEVDVRRLDAFGGHDKIAFVFAAGIIHHHHHAAAAQVGEHRFD